MRSSKNKGQVNVRDAQSGHPFLHIHLNPIHLKYTHVSKLPDFVGVQQLHSSCAFVEVIFEGYAAVPFLDLTAASPEAYVDGLGTGEDFA